MGQSAAAPKEVPEERGEKTPPSPPSPVAPHEPPRYREHPHPAPAASHASLRFLGFTEQDVQKKVMPDSVSATVANALPGSCKSSSSLDAPSWYLLYNSDIHGKSFQRLVQRITNKGPTVIVIKIHDSQRVIGAFCESDWLTVADREKLAKSRAAAAKRSEREGQRSSGYSERPANQNNVFFGGERCFVFSAGGNGEGSQPSEGTVFHSHPSMNSNFMYLFDTHPIVEKEGIGMGGQPGYFGWFVDRWLENGSCNGVRCTTFQCPRLSDAEVWKVEAIEVYAVREDIVQQLVKRDDGDVQPSSCLTANPDTDVDKMILELHGVHNFNAAERPDC